MIKSLFSILKQDKDSYIIPKSVQQVIPIKKIWNDGIFLVGKNKYALTFKVADINYAVASREDKEAMFLDYSELLNSLDTGATTKITVALRPFNKNNFEKEILLPLKNDNLDIYRQEYNQMLLDKAMETNGMLREIYLTVSVYKKDYEEARNYFRRVYTDISSHLSKLGSKCIQLDATEKLRILYDFYRMGEEANYHLKLKDLIKHGHDFKDYICPDGFIFEKDYFEMGDKYGRVLFLKDYASYIKDSMVAELTDMNQNMMLSIDIIPIPTDEAVKEVEKILLGVETNITNWQRRQNTNSNFSAVVPYDMQQQRKETKEFLDDLTNRDQKMMFANLTLVITAESKSDLDTATEKIFATAGKYMCHMSVLNYQQMDGLNTVLPIGVRKINALRTLTTESLSVLNPFKVQEIMDRGGIYYGVNAISHNLIMVNKENLLNQSAFLLGVPGSGKSFSAKELIAFLVLSTDDDILICDPEDEYSDLIRAMGGEVINVSASSKDHINAMDMSTNYGDGINPVVNKSEFMLSLFEQVYKKGLGPKDKSIIDRCTSMVYEEAKKSGEVPTLIKLRKKLEEQPENEAKDLALCLELFTNGSLNVFAHETNVDNTNRIISYNIRQLGNQLKPMGLVVITDAMINRVSENYKKGKRTHIFIDEFHVLFENEYSASFFTSAWRQFRKRNAYPTAITQNVEYLLSSVEASTMLSNSEFIVMLNQASSDRKELARLLNISDKQLSYITSAKEGCGLIRYGNSLVPFINKFPDNTKLYKLMTTKPGE